MLIVGMGWFEEFYTLIFAVSKTPYSQASSSALIEQNGDHNRGTQASSGTGSGLLSIVLNLVSSDPEHSYSFVGTRAGTIHALTAYTPPQSKHFVTANRAAHCGQTACVWNASNNVPQWLHVQKPPTGGAALHAGQANPS